MKDVAIVNEELLQAARETLARIVPIAETLQPLYLQPDRTIFLAANAGIILKVYSEGKTLEREYVTARQAQARGVPIPELLRLDMATPAVLAMKYVIGQPLSSYDEIAAREAGRYIERFHSGHATPPFAGGQSKWDEFILWWAQLEIGRVEQLDVFTAAEVAKLRRIFEDSSMALMHRPVVLLHGDLQSEHILIDPKTQKVVAFLDFADAQPGDPLLDIAILSLWDTQLADLVLAGYSGIENNEQNKYLLSLYRLLRHVGEVPWLLERGFEAYAERDIKAVKRLLAEKD